MSDPIDAPGRLVRVELDGGASVSGEDAGGSSSPAVVLRLSAERAHALAHLLGDWSGLFRLLPDRSDRPSSFVLSRALEDVAAALGERGALSCASRARGSVPADQRLAAVGVLRDREPELSAAQRIAVVDSAARWMDDEAGDELAYALLRAACSTDVTTSRAYLALLTPPAVADSEAD
jgi:hypothetical protein